MIIENQDVGQSNQETIIESEEVADLNIEDKNIADSNSGNDEIENKIIP